MCKYKFLRTPVLVLMLVFPMVLLAWEKVGCSMYLNDHLRHH